MLELLQCTLDGLLEAGPYALIGLGLTLSFGLLKRINLAFGATALLAAYLGSWLHIRFGMPVIVVWLAVIGASIVIGFYVEWLCFEKSNDYSSELRRQNNSLIGFDTREATIVAASFAVWMQLEQLAVNFQPSHLHPFPDMSSSTNLTFGELSLRPDRIVVLLVTLGFICLVSVWLKRSHYGLGLRAVSSHQAAAYLCGMNVSRIRYAGTALTCAMCGIASCAVLSMDGQVTPMFGMWVLLKGLTCALLGRLGSVRGVLGGAVLLGITEAHAQNLWGAIGRDIATWGLLLLALLVQANRFSKLKKQIQGDAYE